MWQYAVKRCGRTLNAEQIGRTNREKEERKSKNMFSLLLIFMASTLFVKWFDLFVLSLYVLWTAGIRSILFECSECNWRRFPRFDYSNLKKTYGIVDVLRAVVHSISFFHLQIHSWFNFLRYTNLRKKKTFSSCEMGNTSFIESFFILNIIWKLLLITNNANMITIWLWNASSLFGRYLNSNRQDPR